MLSIMASNGRSAETAYVFDEAWRVYRGELLISRVCWSLNSKLETALKAVGRKVDALKQQKQQVEFILEHLKEDMPSHWVCESAG